MQRKNVPGHARLVRTVGLWAETSKREVHCDL